MWRTSYGVGASDSEVDTGSKTTVAGPKYLFQIVFERASIQQCHALSSCQKSFGCSLFALRFWTFSARLEKRPPCLQLPPKQHCNTTSMCKGHKNVQRQFQRVLHKG